MKLIDKAALLAELDSKKIGYNTDGKHSVEYDITKKIIDIINTLEVKEFQETNLYVVTRCEEHSDYVEKAFFSRKKAEEYCKQFEGNEDAYGRDITEIKVDCPIFEAKEVDLKKELENFIEHKKAWIKDNREVEYNNGDSFNHIYDLEKIAENFFELGIKIAQERRIV